MKRLTVEKPASEMNMIDLAHNCMYAKDRWAWYRDYDSDMDLRDFIRKFSEAEGIELPDDNKTLDDILVDNLQYGINDPNGRTALVYRLMWAMADLRETLMDYENTGVNPKEIEGMIHKWIPIKERLPEKPKENPLYDNKPLEIYLVSVKNTDCVIRAFWNGATFTDGWEKLDVLAWMPLPEPYKEAEG